MNLKFMMLAMSQKGIKAFYFNDNSFSLDGEKMEIRNNTIIAKSFTARFVGAKGFLRELQFEGYLIGCDITEVLLRYDFLVREKCLPVDGMG